jgi:hypothetical protein
MKDHLEAVGDLSAYAAAVGWGFQYYQPNHNPANEEYHVDMDIYTNSEVTGTARILGHADQQLFTALSSVRLSNLDNFDLSDSPEYIKVRENAVEIANSIGTNTTTVIPKERDRGEKNDMVEYFDGFQAEAPLFVYEDDFTPRRFREVVSEVGQSCYDAFIEAIDEFEIELDSEPSREEAHGREDFTPSYQ